MKIAVVTPKCVYGERGGAENLYTGLVAALNRSGHQATQIDVIVDESTFGGILEAYSRCFYFDLNDYDLVISTKAPTYMVQHKNHISYLLHPIRVFYDMFETEFNPCDSGKLKQRNLIHEFDKYGLNPIRIKKNCVIGEVVADRMRDADLFWQNIEFDVIYPAPLITEFQKPQQGEFVFLPGRLHRWKRVDLVIKAMKYIRSDVKLLLAGVGEDAKQLEIMVQNLGLEGRVQFLGKVSEKQLLDLYSRSIVVPFVPINEDFGYITIEAFKSKKPVITCVDSGEPARIVKDSENGFVVAPDPKEIADKIEYCINHPEEAERMGENGYHSVCDITWDNVVSRLLSGVSIAPRVEPQHGIDVLVTDMQPIEPAVGGGRLRLKGLYSNLGSGINPLYLGTYDWSGEHPREIMVSDTLKEVDIPLHNEHFQLNDYFNALLPDKTIIDSLFSFLGEASPKFVDRVVEEAKKRDVIVFSHPWLYPLVKTRLDLSKKVVIYDSQNCEAVLRSQLLGSSAFARCISHMVNFVEMELCEMADLILACSEIDRDQFVRLYHVNPMKIEVFPNGADAKMIHPVQTVEKAKIKKLLGFDQKSAVFIGSDYPPNVEGGQFIIDTLADACPDVLFLIVGGVGGRLKSNKSNIRIYGKVSEEKKLQILSAADIAINPIFNGSGTNIKMFDFLAAGLPTISSPVGARGIIHEDSFIVADPLDFPQAIRALLEKPELYSKLMVKGRALVDKYYDWNTISSNLGRRIIELHMRRKPFFSVIIPTLRGDHLKKVIASLNNQSFKDFEVVIVDSKESRGLELEKMCFFPLKYVLDQSAGAVRARNIGIAQSNGKVIAFTDDDCQPDPDWLENAKKIFQSRNIVGIEGSIYSDESKMGDPNYRLVTNKGFEGLGFMTANLFIRREVLEKIGGFDERFDKPHFREDTDLAWRAQKYGEIPFSHDVRVYHPPQPRNIGGESKEERDRFFIHDPLLFSKHPDKYLKLIKTEGHFRNSSYWHYFIEGIDRYGVSVPLNYMVKDSEIRSFIPSVLRDRLQ